MDIFQSGLCCTCRAHKRVHASTRTWTHKQTRTPLNGLKAEIAASVKTKTTENKIVSGSTAVRYRSAALRDIHRQAFVQGY